MKILFVNRAFDQMAGGVERAISQIMRGLAERGHQVSVMSWDHEDAQAFYDFPAGAEWHKIGIGDPQYTAGLGTKLRRAARVREIVKQVRPDIILAFQDGAFISTRLYTLCMGVPVVLCERNAPSRFNFIKAGKKRARIYQTFRLAHAITVQCESFKPYYPKYLQSKIAVIPNPIFPVASAGKKESDIKTLLCVGRLCYQKNQDVLLEAFSLLHKKFPDWHLSLVGDGEDREKVERLIAQRELSDHVTVHGAVRDVSRHYNEADLFCLPSRWEGFPNALGEAMAHGLPSVGYAECAGVRDLLKDGKNGTLARDHCNAQSLAKALEHLMSDHNLRRDMGEAARGDIVQYAPARIFDMWDDFIKRQK